MPPSLGELICENFELLICYYYVLLGYDVMDSLEAG